MGPPATYRGWHRDSRRTLNFSPLPSSRSDGFCSKRISLTAGQFELRTADFACFRSPLFTASTLWCIWRQRRGFTARPRSPWRSAGADRCKSQGTSVNTTKLPGEVTASLPRYFAQFERWVIGQGTKDAPAVKHSEGPARSSSRDSRFRRSAHPFSARVGRHASSD